MLGTAVLAAALVVPVVSSEPGAAAAPSKQQHGVRIEVLSNRADLVSSGDALVEVVLPPGVHSKALRVDVDGRDVSQEFVVRDDGRLIGLVEGLDEGDNRLTAKVRPSPRSRSKARNMRSAASITITNHPTGGPIFSGPHLEPWLCTTQTEANGLGPAEDEQCNAPTKVDYFYQPAGGDGLQPYDPAAPPNDVATTTTDDGETVPFVVRRERGTMNRGIYDVAVLFDPAEPWDPGAPQAGWNGKVVWPFGPSSGTVHSQGAPSQVLNPARLGQGFMVATSSLNVHGSNLNTVVSAESVTMLKEHIIETYGPIRYTIGQGGSGGAIQQQLIANAYPGLLDGIIPVASFPDTWTTGVEVVECIGLNHYFNANADLWPDADRIPVRGHQSNTPCTFWEIAYAEPSDPTAGCGLPAEQQYHPEDNPTGVRCTAQDYTINIWGARDEDGFAKRAGSNRGVQYGLKALQAGQISAEQFVHLNENVGSRDHDAVQHQERLPSDPGATEIAYRTGQVNDGGQLDQVPIIDLRPSENNGIHTNYHSWALRQRLVEANGHADNHVIYFSPDALPGDAGQEAFELMDQWLAAVEADGSGDPLDVKVARNKPVEAVDTCFVGGERITDQEICLTEAPYFESPRIAAGGPPTHDVIECQLEPLDRSAYPVQFTNDQWNRLEYNAFPSGVCDWTQPAVDRQPSVPWLSYADGPGGKPLGDSPVSATCSVRGKATAKTKVPPAHCRGN